MQTKYVRSHSGLFAIFSENLGMQHIDVAEHIDDARNVSDAGFLFVEDGRVYVHGKSESLGIASKGSAETVIHESFEAGRIRLYRLSGGLVEGYIATNAELVGDFEPLTDLAQLFKKRIMR